MEVSTIKNWYWRNQYLVSSWSGGRLQNDGKTMVLGVPPILTNTNISITKWKVTVLEKPLGWNGYIYISCSGQAQSRLALKGETTRGSYGSHPNFGNAFLVWSWEDGWSVHWGEGNLQRNLQKTLWISHADQSLRWLPLEQINKIGCFQIKFWVIDMIYASISGWWF